MPHLSIRIDFEPSGSALGPGMAQLLERVDELGSIRRAAASMDMSYRKAWLLIQELQKTFDGPVVTAEAGGLSGGGTHLTELGTGLVKLYRRGRAALPMPRGRIWTRCRRWSGPMPQEEIAGTQCGPLRSIMAAPASRNAPTPKG